MGAPGADDVALEEPEEDVHQLDLGLDALLVDDRDRVLPLEDVEEVGGDVEVVLVRIVEAEDDGAEAVLLLHGGVEDEVLLGVGGAEDALGAEVVRRLVELAQTVVPAGSQ